MSAPAHGDTPAEGWDAHVHVFDAQAPARAGHYQPVDRPLAAIETLAAAHGVHHLVLVQPSVYGTDHRVLLQALALHPGRHRGVAVVANDIREAELDRLHDAGVRGVRFNLVSPVGEDGDPRARFAALAPRLRSRGWHVQWYARLADLPLIHKLHQRSGLTAVLDHLAGFGTGVAADDPAWPLARALADDGAWLKLSGWYRLGDAAPYTRLVPTIAQLADVFGQRLVWGSDWPHTAFAPDALPPYASTWQPVVDALGEPRALSIRRRVPDLYR